MSTISKYKNSHITKRIFCLAMAAMLIAPSAFGQKRKLDQVEAKEQLDSSVPKKKKIASIQEGFNSFVLGFNKDPKDITIQDIENRIETAARDLYYGFELFWYLNEIRLLKQKDILVKVTYGKAGSSSFLWPDDFTWNFIDDKVSSQKVWHKGATISKVCLQKGDNPEKIISPYKFEELFSDQKDMQKALWFAYFLQAKQQSPDEKIVLDIKEVRDIFYSLPSVITDYLNIMMIVSIKTKDVIGDAVKPWLTTEFIGGMAIGSWFAIDSVLAGSDYKTLVAMFLTGAISWGALVKACKFGKDVCLNMLPKPKSDEKK
jgi:hypothetical protein